MPLILSIETTTKVCSVALHRDGKLINLQESHDEDYTHAEKLNVFIEKALKEAGLKPNDLDAIAVAGGPGSYTGLRIGVSSAKGLCYAIDKPLIAVDPLKALALQYTALTTPDTSVLVFPMIDARRDEVFMSVFNGALIQLGETKAQIITSDYFDQFADKKCVLVGDGAPKFAELFISKSNVEIVSDCVASAGFIGVLAALKYESGEFENLAYYEPQYGKEFQTTVSTKLNKIRTSNS